MPAESFIEAEIKAQFAVAHLERGQMHDYQQDGYEFLRERKAGGLFFDMGLGKCVTTGTVITDLLRDDETEKVLIIGPLKVATTTWPDELRAWKHLAAYSFTVLREDDDDPRLADARREAGKKARADAEYWELPTEQAQSFVRFQQQRGETAMRHQLRREAAMSRTQIHIVSREHVEWLVYFWKHRWPYRTVVIDESSGFKDHTTHRWRALKKVRNSVGLIERFYILTATPATETYEHLWAQIYLLDGGERLGKTITKYRERYFTYNRWSMKFKLREGAEEEILAKIADICLVKRARDHLPLQEPTFIERQVHLSARQMALYSEMEKEFIVELPDGTKVEAETAAALSSKLLQMASGVLYETLKLEDFETGDLHKVKKIHELHNHKIDSLREIHEGLQGEPLLVAYHHRASLDRLIKTFPSARAMDREGKLVKAWNKGSIDMLLIHPQSGGHGLNMQHGGHNLVFFDLPWSLELFLQLIGRLSRQGQKHPVIVQLLIATGTIDEVVWSALKQKQDAQERLLTILKKLHRRLRASTNSAP